jgi:hypothetical protein
LGERDCRPRSYGRGTHPRLICTAGKRCASDLYRGRGVKWRRVLTLRVAYALDPLGP